MAAEPVAVAGGARGHVDGESLSAALRGKDGAESGAGCAAEQFGDHAPLLCKADASATRYGRNGLGADTSQNDRP